jgi:hypothetical protein
MLRQLPGNLYQNIGHMEAVFSQLYYLCIPRAALTTILSLLVLRERTCRELGIEMRPIAEADYEKGMSEYCKFSMKDLASSFMKFPTKIALGMFGGVSTLLAWHPEWQKTAPEIEEKILAKEKELQDRQEQMDEAVKKSLEEPRTQINNTLELVEKKETNIDKNYGPNIEHNGGMLSLPDGSKETPKLDNYKQ